MVGTRGRRVELGREQAKVETRAGAWGSFEDGQKSSTGAEAWSSVEDGQESFTGAEAKIRTRDKQRSAPEGWSVEQNQGQAEVGTGGLESQEEPGTFRSRCQERESQAEVGN